MNKYQEALDELRNFVEDDDNNEVWTENHLSNMKGHLTTIKELVDKETPKRFEIIDRELIFHSTPNPTEYYLTIKCSCGKKFECRGYQHWKVIDKHNVEKDYFEYEYSYCPNCGQKLDWGDKDE